jgi:hypothetical protein
LEFLTGQANVLMRKIDRPIPSANTRVVGRVRVCSLADRHGRRPLRGLSRAVGSGSGLQPSVASRPRKTRLTEMRNIYGAVYVEMFEYGLSLIPEAQHLGFRWPDHGHEGNGRERRWT